jgi:hypothetical protein
MTLPGKSQKGQLFFLDNFSKDTIGKSPSYWESNVRGEIVTVKNEPGKWLKMHASGTYLPIINKLFPDLFTLEFDFIYQALGTDYNITEITMFSDKPGDTYDVSFPGSAGIKIFLENFIVSYACYSGQKIDDQLAQEHRTNIIQTDKKVKVSIQVDKREVAVYIDGQKIMVAQRCPNTILPFNAMRFNLWGSQAEPLISNIRLTAP